MFQKFGEAFEITESNLHTESSALSDPEIRERFTRFAAGLKRIAPKAKDFLYFSAVMMHAAEAALINADGTVKTANGKPVTAKWDKKGSDSLTWNCSDSSIRPYRNSNGDIFPEEELLKAHKRWVGKPLCIDHKSSSVDFIRGVIVDTYYDRSLRRVVALCALDKVNYPDLARKVSSGYATSVSMGTAVGKAICTDCGTAARTEKDFCQHMRAKSCYGEINVDLQPIELSIVVNGADPQAKIKHIIASANHLNSYAESKEQEVSQEVDLIGKAVEDIKSRLDALVNDFEEESKHLDESEDEGSADESTSEDSHDSNFSMDINDAKDAVDEGESKNESVEKAATDNNGAFINEFFDLKASIENKLAKLQEDFNKLSIQLNEESRNVIMDKKGYFQGAGGVNEPTPGKTKYEVDPMNEKLRTSGDKQMEGQMDTGPVDGMHPGPQSAGVNELERKKMLARAEAEERAIRRQAALKAAKETLQSRAYFQGGDEEPTPGKPQYKADDLNEKTRAKEDKQMTGQAPFPNTGAVDGLHPSPESAVKEMGAPKDELKRKELLQRASLKARFVKAATSNGSEDLGNSAWQVFADDKLVLTASVSQLSGGRADALYAAIATKDFGKKMLEKVKSVGIDKAAALYTQAQDMGMPAPAAAAPAMPEMGDAAAPAAAPASDMGAADGDVGETAKTLVSELKETVSDLGEAVEALVAERGDMAAPAGDMGAVTASLHKMRRELNSSLIEGMKKSASDLSDHAEELQLIGNIFEGSNVTAANREYVESIAQDAIAEAKAALAESAELVSTFVRYATGTEAMLKNAALEKALSKKADLGLDLEADLGAALEHDAHEHAAVDADCVCPVHGGMTEEMPADEMMADDDMMADDMMGDSNDATIEVKPADVAKLDTTHLAPTDKVQVTASFDLSTREGRTAYRTKLAAETLTDSDVLTEAHPGGGVTTDLDVKPEGDLAKVETREEVAAAMMDLANAPPKVRKEAEEINKLVLAGKLAATDVDSLVAHGLDAAAVSYYKKFFGQVDGGSEFAAELVKEHAKAAAEAELSTYKTKMARAWQLAYEMVARGLCADEQTVIATQVDEIMKYNDEAFESLKRVVATTARGLKKEAGRIPAVGFINEGDSKPVAAEGGNLFSELNKAFSNRKY